MANATKRIQSILDDIAHPGMLWLANVHFSKSDMDSWILDESETQADVFSDPRASMTWVCSVLLGGFTVGQTVVLQLLEEHPKALVQC